MGEFFGHKDSGNVSWKNVYLEYVDGFTMPIIHIKDLSFNNASGNEWKYVPGKSFLAPAVCRYYHMITDVYATFESIKSVHPDISIVHCSKDELSQYNEAIDLPYRAALDLLDIYGNDEIVMIEEENIVFEHVLLFPTKSVWFMDRVVPKKIQDENFDNLSHNEMFIDRPRYLDIFKNLVRPNFLEKEKKKIYSARMPYVGASKELIDKYIKDTDPTRAYLDEIKIIEYFQSLGYEIVNLDQLGFYEQMRLFSNAKSVAGIKGSNIFNAFMCEKQTEIIQINVQNFWGYQFEDYFEYFDLNIVDICKEKISKMVPENKEFVSVEEILAELDKYFGDPERT